MDACAAVSICKRAAPAAQGRRVLTKNRLQTAADISHNVCLNPRRADIALQARLSVQPVIAQGKDKPVAAAER